MIRESSANNCTKDIGFYLTSLNCTVQTLALNFSRIPRFVVLSYVVWRFIFWLAILFWNTGVAGPVMLWFRGCGSDFRPKGWRFEPRHKHHWLSSWRASGHQMAHRSIKSVHYSTVQPPILEKLDVKKLCMNNKAGNTCIGLIGRDPDPENYQNVSVLET